MRLDVRFTYLLASKELRGSHLFLVTCVIITVEGALRKLISFLNLLLFTRHDERERAGNEMKDSEPPSLAFARDFNGLVRWTPAGLAPDSIGVLYLTEATWIFRLWDRSSLIAFFVLFSLGCFQSEILKKWLTSERSE